MSPEVPRIVRESAEVYHANDARISRSQLATFIESRKLFHRRHILDEPYWQQEETKAMLDGRQIHSLVLDGLPFEKLFTVIPSDVLNDDGHCRGKTWLNFKADNVGKNLVKEADITAVREMWNALKDNETAAELLFAGDAAENELGLHWNDIPSGLLMRARLDRIRPGHAIVDLKTIDDCTPRKCEQAIEERLYYMQGAVYVAAWAAVTETLGERQELPFILVFVGKTKPHDVITVQLSETWMERGKELAYRATTELAECIRTGDWTQPTGRGIIVMDPPFYAKNSWRPMPWQRMEETRL